MTVPSRAATFDMIRPATFTTAPAGKRLGTSGTVHGGKTLLYRGGASSDCDACRLNRSAVQKNHRARSRATYMSTPGTSPGRSRTEGIETSRRQRKKIEMRFAHLKRILRLGRFGFVAHGRRGRVVLAAIAQNRALRLVVARLLPLDALVRCEEVGVESVRVADQSRSALPNGRKTSVGYSRLLQQNRPCPDIATGGAG